MKKKINNRGHSFYQKNKKNVIFPPIKANNMKISSKNFFPLIKKRNIVHTPDYNKKILLEISSYKNTIKKKDNEINFIENKKEILEGKQIFNEKIAKEVFLKDNDVKNIVMKDNSQKFLDSNIISPNNETIAKNYKINVEKLEDKKKEYLEGKKEIADLKNELAAYNNSILNIESKISQKIKEINNQKNKINIVQNNKNQREEILEKAKQLLFEKNNLNNLNEEIKQNENILNENNLKIKNNEKEIESLKKELEKLKKNI